MDGMAMGTDELKLSKAASEYIERWAAFWLMENDPEFCLQDLKEETLNLCLEDLYREWVELARPAVETVNEKWVSIFDCESILTRFVMTWHISQACTISFVEP